MTVHDSLNAGKNGVLGQTAATMRRQIGAVVAGVGEHAPAQRAALAALSIRIASAAIAYASQVLLARLMGGFEYGIFVFVWVWVLILGGLSSLGLSTATIRFIPEYLTKKRPGDLAGLLRASRLITLGVSSAVALTGLAGLTIFADIIDPIYLLPASLILVCMPMYALIDIQDGLCRGFGWIGLALVPPYILRPLLLLAAFGCAVLLGFEATAVTAAGAAIASAWVSGLAQWLAIEWRVRRDIKRAAPTYQMSLWMATALPMLLFHGFELFLQNTDILVLSLYAEPQEIGIYFAALKTIGLVSFVHFAVGTAVANKFAGLNAQGSREKLRRFVAEAARWTFWPSLCAALVLLAAGKPLLWLFGAEFTSGYPIMFILAAGLVLRAAMGPAEYVLNMLGEQKSCAAVLFGAAALNIGLNFALIPEFGMYGAAVATAASMWAAALAMFAVARVRLGLDLFAYRAR
jgi:O-antigen/teichoic acid export membrane protein